jgi:glycosyltransferase involved in cell wall biosynthesis
MMVYPSALHRQLELRRMRRLLGTASAIVMSTSEAVHRLHREFPELRDRPVVAIPNGFDAADFTVEPTPRVDDKFRIVHTGYLHTELGLQQRNRGSVRTMLGGGVRGLDILTRSHVYLVDAINTLLQRDPQLRDVVELHLAGVLNETDRSVAARCPVVTLHGYMSHSESIELMRTGDLLFLPMQNLPPGVRATIVPGKTYEYLASGTPILGAVPEGDARDILTEAGNASLVRPDDVEGLAAAIARAVDRFRSGEDPHPPNSEVVARFEYRKLAADPRRCLRRPLDGSAGQREELSLRVDRVADDTEPRRTEMIGDVLARAPCEVVNLEKDVIDLPPDVDRRPQHDVALRAFGVDLDD